MRLARTIAPRRTLSLLVLPALASAGSTMSAAAKPVQAGHVQTAVPADRWLEMDLYWFDPTDVAASADRFWQRYAPLYRHVAGYKGVVLNVGGTVEYVVAFSGDLDQPISLPKGTGQELSVDVAGQLDGDTAARQRAWRARFAEAANGSAQVGYGAWTYRRLATLAEALRAEARRHGIDGFRVATLVTAGDGAYGEVAPFARTHPEAWTSWRPTGGTSLTSGYFDPMARLNADPSPRAGLPGGIVAGTTAADLLAAQWGALSRRVGLDGLMLRDSFGFARSETRYGPWGANLPDPAKAAAITGAVAGMVRAIKLANPRALTMMYSSAASATGDWRGNGLDLESVAREGYLDIFVDQTWAGAWGEVGVRQQTFWNAPILGWTYQLAYLLQHAATLATSRVHHYHLVETFDAWESWDTIHTAPERLRWGIWAYSHAGVKTPTGMRMPAGAYISWANHGHALLSDADVGFIGGELDAAERDAATVTQVFGPTLVYARDAAREQMTRGAAGGDPRDRIDETVATMVKWPLPLLSATRIEWLPRVASDLFVFGATTGIAPAAAAAVADLAASSQPIALLSAPADTDPALASLAGVTFAPYRPALQDRTLRAVRGAAASAVDGVPAQFDAVRVPMQASASAASVIYSVGPSAALTLDRTAGRSVAWWSPTPIDDAWYVPTRQLMPGGPASFVLAAATLSEQLARADRLHAAPVALDQSGTVAAWRTRDGAISILVANLEEGLRDDADRSRQLGLSLPAVWRGRNWRPAWDAQGIERTGEGLSVGLAPQASRLLRGE